MRTSTCAQPYNISVPLDLNVTCDTRLILNIYKRLKIKPNSVRMRSFNWRDEIWTHTINTLQHQSISLVSSALDHATTSAILKCSFNSRSVTLSRKENLEIYIRHVSKRVFDGTYILNIIIWQQSNSAIFNILYRMMKHSSCSHRK
jgi:hypothetical protein